MNWLNLYGIIIMVVIMIPNIIFGLRNKEYKNNCTSKFMNYMEQIGRYGSIFFLIFNIGILEVGFRSDEVFAVWLVVVILLLLLYTIHWGLYFKRKENKIPLVNAIIPSILIVSSGFLMRDYLLLVSGMIFSVGHIYVTVSNIKYLE